MIRNVAFGGVRALLVAPIPFLLTPLILRKIGARGYGTWAVFVAMNSLTSLADLGLLGTLSKYVAEHHVRKEFAQLNRLLNTGMAVFGIVASLIVFILSIASAEAVKILFRGSTLSANELLHLFHCALVLVFINIMTFLCSSVTSGLQRLDLTNMVATFNVASAAGIGAVLLLLGWGVRGLLYGNIAAAAVSLLIYSGLIRRLLPEFRLNPLQATVGEARKIFKFSFQIYVTQAAVAIHNQIEKFFLALFVGVVPVGWYDIASDFALKVRSVPGLMLGPILPAASELDARGDHHKLGDLYYRSHKYLAFVGVPAVLFVAAVAKQFVRLWIGPSLAAVVVLPIDVLLLVNFFNLMTGPGYLILAGQGFLRPGVYSAVLGIALNVPLSYCLIHFYGFKGAIIGTSISLVAASAFFLFLFHRHTQTSLARVLSQAYIKPILSSVLILGVLSVVRPANTLSLMGLVIQGVVFGFLYLAFLLFTKFFDPYDWKRIESIMPIARIARRVVPVA